MKLCITADSHITVSVRSDLLWMIYSLLKKCSCGEKWEGFLKKVESTGLLVSLAPCQTSFYYESVYLKCTLNSKGMLSSIIKFWMHTSGWKGWIIVENGRNASPPALKLIFHNSKVWGR